jgi:hypothetical protein
MTTGYGNSPSEGALSDLKGNEDAARQRDYLSTDQIYNVSSIFFTLNLCSPVSKKNRGQNYKPIN